MTRYGAFVAAGLVLGLYIAWREARRRRVDPEAVLDLCLWAALAGIAGARLEHVLFNLTWYLSRPAEILRLSEGGLSIHGALIAGTAMVYAACRRNKLPFARVADLLAPAVALGEAVGRLGCDLVGRPGPWPFALTVDGARYANIPLYSSAYLALLFAYLWFWVRPRSRVDGEVVLSYVLWYSAGRFLIEFARESPPVLAGLSLAQVVSVALVAVSAAVLLRLRQKAADPQR